MVAKICKRCQFRVAQKSKICSVCGSTALLKIEQPVSPPPAHEDVAEPSLQVQARAAHYCANAQPVNAPAECLPAAESQRQLSSLRQKFAERENVPVLRWDQKLTELSKHVLGR